jgi:prepilin-type N-terminal cleavage/methylation domain-containing protein
MKSLRKIHWRKNSDHQEGFTLVELLVVIVILGILAAIVVFAVTGITGKGQTQACSTDASTIQAAENAAFAQSEQTTAAPVYISMASLVSGGFLHTTSNYWSLAPSGSGTAASYTLTGMGACNGATAP